MDSSPAQPGAAQRAFRPDEGIRAARSYLRQRAGLVTECGRTIQHMQKALEQMNVKLTEAVSDITGKTGMSILKAILAGERDPTRLGAARPPLPAGRRADRAGSARDLEEEHLFELRQAVERWEFYHRQISVCDEQIQTHLQTLQDPNAGEPPGAFKCAGGNARPTARVSMRGGRCTG